MGAHGKTDNLLKIDVSLKDDMIETTEKLVNKQANDFPQVRENKKNTEEQAE